MAPPGPWPPIRVRSIGGTAPRCFSPGSDCARTRGVWRRRLIPARASRTFISVSGISLFPSVFPIWMHDRLSPEALFVEHLAWIDRVASMTCGKYGVWGAEAEDFTAWVRMKLMENDYAVLRKFRGNSELKTYLASVVFRHVVSHIRATRGRWRPSAAAIRLGPPAPDLELLVHRDRYTLPQAGEKLRLAGRTTLSDAELARLLERLPTRGPLRPKEVESERMLEAASGDLHADDRVRAAEAAAHYEKTMEALRRAMEQLEAEDRLIVQMHFADGISLADVARGLGLEQKPLYRRAERLRVRLRAILESEGLGEGDVHDIIFESDDP